MVVLFHRRTAGGHSWWLFKYHGFLLNYYLFTYVLFVDGYQLLSATKMTFMYALKGTYRLLTQNKYWFRVMVQRLLESYVNILPDSKMKFLKWCKFVNFSVWRDTAHICENIRRPRGVFNFSIRLKFLCLRLFFRFFKCL